MLKIFIILQLIPFENRMEVVSKTNEHFVVYKENADYEYIGAILQLAQKRGKPVVVSLGDQADIHKIALCKQLTVSSIRREEDSFKILFLPMAGIYKLDIKNTYLLDILNQSLKFQKNIWVGIDEQGNVVSATL